VNGQEPIKEENKLIYWMINYIFVAYNHFRLSLQDIHQIMIEKNIEKSEKLRQFSFQYLSKKNYHHIHSIICQERSLQKTLPDELKTEFNHKANMHKKEYSALVIQGVWRNYKIQRNTDVIEHKKNFTKQG
jgi:hypothetical protein